MRLAHERIDTSSSADRFQVALHEQRFEFVLSQLARVHSILEVGTGVGSLSQRLTAICDHYTGLEYDPATAVQAGLRVAGKGRVVQGDARQLPFEPRSFSAIVCLEVLEHLGDWLSGIKGIQKCLKPDGVAIASVPYRKSGGTSEMNRFHLYEPGESEFVRAFGDRFGDVSVWYQSFPESLAMGLARVLHARRLLGLEKHYRDLSTGEPEAVARLRISQNRRGFNLHLIIVARRPLPA